MQRYVQPIATGEEDALVLDRQFTWRSNGSSRNLSFGLIPFGGGFLYLVLAVMVWTLGEMLVIPSLTTLVAQRAPADLTGRYMGLHSVGFSLGVTLGPGLGMGLLARVGGGALRTAVAALCVLLSVGFGAIERSLKAPVRL